MNQPVKVIWPEHPFRRDAKPPKVVTSEEYAIEMGVSKTTARNKLEEMVIAGTVTKTKRKSDVSSRSWVAVYTFKESSNGEQKTRWPESLTA